MAVKGWGGGGGCSNKGRRKVVIVLVLLKCVLFYFRAENSNFPGQKIVKGNGQKWNSGNSHFCQFVCNLKCPKGDPVLRGTYTKSWPLFYRGSSGRGDGDGTGVKGSKNLADTDTDEQTAMELTAGIHWPKRRKQSSIAKYKRKGLGP